MSIIQDLGLDVIGTALQQIAADLHRFVNVYTSPTKIQIHFEGEKMPATISKNVGSTVHITVTETNAENQPVPIVPANITYDDGGSTIGTLTTNADGSADFVNTAAGSVTITANDTAFKLSDSGVATFSADTTPTTLTINFA